MQIPFLLSECLYHKFGILGKKKQEARDKKQGARDKLVARRSSGHKKACID